MKKSILALALLGASASTAFAQSSVTVFGILDVNVRSIKNNSTTIKQLGNNGFSANQLGFRGVEDLGGGLRAGFWIESALSPDVGTATTENGSTKFWQRRATVSLMGNFGEVRLGRDLDPSYLNLANEAFGNLGTGSLLNFVTGLGSGVTTIVRADNMVAYHTPATTENGSTKFWQRRATVSLMGNFGEVRLGRDLDPSYLNLANEAFGNLGTGSLLNFVTGLGSGVTTIVRADNMVAYHTPATLGGFFGSAAVAAGEGVPGGKYKAGRVGYAAGPIFVAAATGDTQTATKDDYKLTNLAASYDLGVAKVFGLYNVQKWGNLDQKLFGLGAHVPLGSFVLRGSVVRVNQSGRTLANVSTDANDANLAALGGVYYLSKRTALYSTVSRISNKGTAAFSVSGGAGVVPAALATGKNSSGYEFGLRHGF